MCLSVGRERELDELVILLSMVAHYFRVTYTVSMLTRQDEFWGHFLQANSVLHYIIKKEK